MTKDRSTSKATELAVVPKPDPELKELKVMIRADLHALFMDYLKAEKRTLRACIESDIRHSCDDFLRKRESERRYREEIISKLRKKRNALQQQIAEIDEEITEVELAEIIAA